MKEHYTVCMLGDGAWGTAIATLLADNGHQVRLWCHDPVAYAAIKSERVNERYLPNFLLPEALYPTQNIDEAVHGAQHVFIAVPVPFLRDVLIQALPWLGTGQTLVILSKGIEQHTLLLPSQIADELTTAHLRVVVISGPSFARDVVNKVPTGVALAVQDQEVATEIVALMSNRYFSLFPTHDVIGVQLGGALKNVLALGAGLLDGAGYGTNAQVLFFTRAFREMVALAAACDAQESTLYGLAGIGDAVLTGMSVQSKNRTIGYRIGKGESLAALRSEYQSLPEGVNTLQSLYQLAERASLSLPIFMSLYSVVFDKQPTAQIVACCLAS